MSKPTPHPFVLLQGTDQSVPINVRDANGDPFDFTGWTGFACHLRKERNGDVSGAPIATPTVVLEHASTGLLSLRLTASESAGVTEQSVVGDIVALDPLGLRHRVVNLDVTVDFQVTTS